MTREIPIPVAVNKRHVHLSKEDARILFGGSHAFSPAPSPERLLWPGHTLWVDKVTLAGPKGTIPRVRVLGLLEDKTGIEISCSDAYPLGLSLQDQKDKRFSPGVTVIGPRGSVFVTMEYPVTGRWIFASKTRAQEHGLARGMRVDARVGGSSGWAVTCHQVYVSVPEDDRGGLSSLPGHRRSQRGLGPDERQSLPSTRRRLEGKVSSTSSSTSPPKQLPNGICSPIR